MKRHAILFLIMALLMPVQASAQRRRTVKKPKKEEVVEDPRITMMRESTQQVVFIDSMVVEKNDFISHIPLSKECGKLLQNGGMGQYTNELGDHRLATVFDTRDSATHITMSDFIANEWTKPAAISGIGDGEANFPYMMPDGTTLYYAQKGEKSIGGYDIFVTRYNPDNSSFLRPENIGMPFASEANDYLYVIDEPQQLGYFVTDRRQPEGMVCIYVFIPSASRKVYQTEAYTEAQMRSLAGIGRIADTWGDGEARRQAMERLREAMATAASEHDDGNDTQQLTELDMMKQDAEAMEKALEASRKYYATASEERRFTLREEILKNEKLLEQMQMQIRQKEKEKRNNNYKITNAYEY